MRLAAQSVITLASHHLAVRLWRSPSAVLAAASAITTDFSGLITFLFPLETYKSINVSNWVKIKSQELRRTGQTASLGP
jgi:hypothetical protein